MCGCCSRAVTSISCRKRSKLTPAARSGDSTLTTTRRPSASSSARNTRLMPPPPSSRSRRYASLRVVCSRSRRSVPKPATFATSEADSKAAPPGWPLRTLGLLVEELQQGWNHLIRRLFHQPVARSLYHHALHAGVDQATLFDEEFAARLLAAQHKHRHGERCLRQLPQLHPVPLERAKPLHARPDVPWPSVGRRVETAIALRDRVRRIGGEVVPKVLQVGSLSTPHQGQRRLAVKMEMPEIPEEPHALPVPHAWNEGVHQHHAFCFLRVQRRVGVRRHQADVMPDDADRCPAALLG